MISNMATPIEAERLLVYKAASLIDEGSPSTMYSSITNYFATDSAIEVTNQAMLMLGGYGYMKEFPIERKLRDAKLLQVVEGTNQIQRLIVARNLIGRK